MTVDDQSESVGRWDVDTYFNGNVRSGPPADHAGSHGFRSEPRRGRADDRTRLLNDTRSDDVVRV